MIILANGAVKSGSTWLFHIARELTHFGPPPARYANPKWQSQPVYSIDQSKLGTFLRDGEVVGCDMLAKNHFGGRQERDLLLSLPFLRVLNITRDIRDVVTSAYHHGRLAQKNLDDFTSYYWRRGRIVAQKVMDYQIIWDVHSTRYLCVSYEELLANFSGEVERIGLFLGQPPTAADIERIYQATSPSALTANYGFSDLNRYRSGTSGDWRNHFDKDCEADLALLIQRSRHPFHRLALTGPAFLRRLCKPWRFEIPRD